MAHTWWQHSGLASRPSHTKPDWTPPCHPPHCSWRSEQKNNEQWRILQSKLITMSCFTIAHQITRQASQSQNKHKIIYTHLLGSELLRCRQVFSIVVAKMVVTNNGHRLCGKKKKRILEACLLETVGQISRSKGRDVSWQILVLTELVELSNKVDTGKSLLLVANLCQAASHQSPKTTPHFISDLFISDL